MSPQIIPPNFLPSTIWTGDNLPVMRGLNSNTVDLIYLAPPFNSKRNFAAPIGSEAEGASFDDTWKLTDIDHAYIDSIKKTMPPIWHMLKAVSGTHSKSMVSYLCFMIPRLAEMKRCLKSSGNIFLGTIYLTKQIV